MPMAGPGPRTGPAADRRQGGTQHTAPGARGRPPSRLSPAFLASGSPFGPPAVVADGALTAR